MNKIRAALWGAILSLALAAVSSAHANEYRLTGGEDYVVIQWDGPRYTHIIRPNGEVEFAATLMPATHPKHSDERSFFMSQLMNKLGREGYQFAGAVGPDEIIMKRAR